MTYDLIQPLNLTRNNAILLRLLHSQQYIDALDMCMQFKRRTVDERQRKAAAKLSSSLRNASPATGRGEEVVEEEDEEAVEEARLKAINADRVLVPDAHVFTAYKRKTKSMYGNDTRRIFMPTMQG